MTCLADGAVEVCFVLNEVGERARRKATTAYPAKKSAPSMLAAGRTQFARSMTAPIPAIPAVINNASEMAQIATQVQTNCLVIPWRRTWAFCAPIATMRDRPVPNPVRVGEMSME